MKKHDVKAEKTINGNRFYIRPFGAFTSANLSGEITSLITPVIGSLIPVAGALSGDEASILDIDAEKAAPALAQGLSGVNGNRIEDLLKKLLVRHRNISVELDDGSEVQTLTEDLADEVFCGDAQDMFILAFEVIKVNYSGFFKSLGGRFGEAIGELLAKVQPSTRSTES